MAIWNSSFPHQGQEIPEDFIIPLNLKDYRHGILIYPKKKFMDIRKEEFPVALQAYEVSGEQVVNTQAEAVADHRCIIDHRLCYRMDTNNDRAGKINYLSWLARLSDFFFVL